MSETISVWKETRGLLRIATMVSSFQGGKEVSKSQFLYDAVEAADGSDLIFNEVADKDFVTIYLMDGTLEMVQAKSYDLRLSQAQFIHDALMAKVKRDGLTLPEKKSQ